VRTIRTGTYAIHHLETETGVRFVLMTDPSFPDGRATLDHIYRDLYIPKVVQNPCASPGSDVTAAAFLDGLDRLGGADR